MKQRLALAQALLPRPELVILDEPTSGLDPGGMVEVRQLIRRLAAEEGITIFLSSHLLNEVEQVCNRVAVIHKGRVLERGNVADLLRAGPFLQVAAEPRERAAVLLRELVCVGGVSDAGAYLRVEASPEHAADVNEALVRGGCRVSALIPGRQSLEDFFLDLVEKRP